MSDQDLGLTKLENDLLGAVSMLGHGLVPSKNTSRDYDIATGLE